MFRKALVVLMAVVFMFGFVGASFAMMCGAGGHEKADAAEASVDAGNTVCPVSGEKIDEKAKATYEYEGKAYNFCCASCIDEFKKDPAKYIKKIEAE